MSSAGRRSREGRLREGLAHTPPHAPPPWLTAVEARSHCGTGLCWLTSRTGHSGARERRIPSICRALTRRRSPPRSIDDIRLDDASPGLRDYEASLLRLLEKVSNGTVVEINETGTRLRYSPGVISGGAGLEHDCGTARGVGYFLEPLVCLGLFAKKARGAAQRAAAASRQGRVC